MQIFFRQWLVLLSVFMVAQTVQASAAEWGYTQQTGPTHWASLGYSLCASGTQQSPVNITQPTVKHANQLAFHYATAPFTRKRDKHNFYAFALEKNNNSLQWNGATYELQSLHFHTPSEHVVNGKHYPFEGHFIHQSSDGKIAVVGVFFKLGRENAALKKLLGTPHEKQVAVNIADFLQSSKDYYTYPGSLTTPPCTEGLTWIVLAKPITISGQQLHFFKEYIIRENSRPPQPLDKRSIIQVEQS